MTDDLFKTLDGEWKIEKRGRGQWLAYIAELIKAPQEIWHLKRGASEELHMLCRFQRGKQRIDAIAVFKRDGDAGEWKEGKTAYTFDMKDGMERKRTELLKDACIKWIDV